MATVCPSGEKLGEVVGVMEWSEGRTVRDERRTHAVSSRYLLYNYFFFFALSKVFRDKDYLVKTFFFFFPNETCMYPVSEGNFLFSKAD